MTLKVDDESISSGALYCNHSEMNLAMNETACMQRGTIEPFAKGNLVLYHFTVTLMAQEMNGTFLFAQSTQ